MFFKKKSSQIIKKVSLFHMEFLSDPIGNIAQADGGTKQD
jgi:hypothetical protein